MVKHEWPQLSEFRDHAVSGVVLPHTPANDILEEKIVRDAQRSGLSNLSVPRRTSIFPAFSRRLSRAIQVKPKPTAESRIDNVTPTRRHRPWSLVVVTERFKRWIIVRKKWCTPANVLAASSFADSMYILISAPLRIGFFFDPWQNSPQHDVWRLELVIFTIFDVTGSILRVWNSRAQLSIGARLILKRRVSQSELAPQQEDDGDGEEEQQGKTTSTRSIRSTTSSSKRRILPDGWISWTILLVYCIPWELLMLLGLRGQRINILHIFGVLRLLTAHSQIGSQLAAAIGGIPQKLASGTVANVMVLFFYGVYFCHVAASGYMLVAHWECGLEFTRCEVTPSSSGCWVLRDRLDKGSQLRQYVRTLYWACKTVVTLGQGDVIPVTLAETTYRIVIQFFAGLWVTAILTAYTFFFTHKDANMTSNISTRLDQALHLGIGLRQLLSQKFGICHRSHSRQRWRSIFLNWSTLRCYCSSSGRRIWPVAMTVDGLPQNEDGARLDSVTSMKTRARESKVFGHGSLLLQAVEARKLRITAATIAAATTVPNTDRILSGRVAQLVISKLAARRLPNSLFRRRWTLAECLLLLYLLGEVPYHLAFQRGFGLLNGVAGSGGDATTPRSFQIASFLVSLCVEIFFYVDLMLRVFYFVRPYPGQEINDEFMGTSTRVKEHDATVGSSLNVPSPALATRSSQIFQLYLQHESLMLEFFALAPAALIWDILPKELFSRRNVHVFRGLRLLRLLRVRKLRRKLRGVMTERGYRPALRLLAEVVIFCTATSHAAACIFFAVADRTSFEGGLPVKGVAPYSLSYPMCLEDASRFDNCTWYMYDRSTFDMDAPYLRSMLWSIVLLSTVGFGDIVAFSTRECIVDALWIFFGANICYITSCALSSVLAQINVLTTIRHDRLESINVLLMSPSMASVSDATKRTVRSYYEAKWKLNGSAVGDLEVLEHLPRSLRRAVSSQLYVPDLRRCVLFIDECGLRAANQNGDAALFMQQLSLIITCEHFLRNVTVIKEGHLATEFFVILSGEVECLLPPVPLEPNASPTKHVSTTRMTRQSIHHAATAAMRRTRASARMARNFTASTLQGGLLKEGSALMRPYIRAPFQPIDEEAYSLRSRSSVTSTRSSITASHHMMKPVLFESSSESLPKLLRYGSLKLVMGALRDPTAADAASVPISVLKQHDYFGEESLSGIPKVYEVSIRAVSSARVAVIKRRDFLVLAARFPHYVARLRARKAALRTKTKSLVAAHRVNFQSERNKKLVRVLGTCTSLYVDSSKSKLEKRGARVLDPTQSFARWWHRGIGFILVYNFYVVIFRLAFLPYPDTTSMGLLTGIDYTWDILLFADVFLKYGHLGYIEFGEVVLDPEAIKRRYRASGLLWQDCLGMLPLYYRGDTFIMSAARLPRLLRCLQLGELLQEVHTEIQERFLRGNAVLLSVFDLVKFFMIFVSTAHYIASLYYLLGWAQLKMGLPDGALHALDVLVSIFHCFGDILARNFLESCYELFTCVLGWVFIGQVIGRINALMITLDKTQKLRNDRVEDFQQYAKQRALPTHLRQRAMKGLVAQAQCQLELDLHSTFRDLPGVLRALVAVEMYSGVLQPLPEFAALSLAQLEVVARALVLEVYLPGDIICEANRVGTRLYIMKHGCAERVSPRTGIVYGALTDGAVFGEFSFFLSGARRLFLVRAVRTCQVLQLHRRVWDRLWPPAIRAQVEHSVLDVVTHKYRHTAWGFLNIAKNFYIKNDSPVPSLGPKRGTTVLRRVFPVLKTSKPRESIRRASKPALATRASASGASALLPAPLRVPFRKRMSGSDASNVSEKADILESYHSILESYRSTRETRDGQLGTPADPTLGISRQMPVANPPPVASPPNFITTEEASTIIPLVRLSASTELRWKRHEKRLRAIQVFHVDWGYVQDDLRGVREVGGVTRRIEQRRVSITVPPSYNEMRASQLETTAKKNRVPIKRRHSIQSDPTDLRSKFKLSPSEVSILEQRMTTPPPTASKTRSYPTMLAQTVASRTRTIQLSQKWWSRRWQSHGKVTPFASTMKAADVQLALQGSPYSIWASPSTRAARFEQNTRFRDVWASVMLAVTLYYLIFIPLQAGFLDGVLNGTDNEAVVITWIALEYLLTDIPCVVDFVLHRSYFVYQTSTGEVVTDPERIARHYWQRGWGSESEASWLRTSACQDVGVASVVQSNGWTGELAHVHLHAYEQVPAYRALAVTE
ncbi:hypothetical protein ON010_g6878 [Phytophthora cinnamomi]|nr:hypothetical protein ON010_g6878 [Phytophthora cinnamomi]